MGRKKKNEAGSTSGEQLELIDVTPENLKAIKPIARRYKAAMQRRVAVQQEEVKAKGEILALIKEAQLPRLADGTIKFKCGDLLITVTPRDELVKVKIKGEEDTDEAEE